MAHSPFITPSVEEFERFHADNKARAMQIALRIVGNKFDAEEVLQEALIRAWRFWGQFDERAMRRTWFSKIVANMAMDKLRNRKRHRAEAIDDCRVRCGNRMFPLLDVLTDPDLIQDQMMIADERRVRVATAAKGLSPGCRAVYARIVAGDWQYCRREPGSVRQARNRIIRMIRKRLAVAA